MDLQLTRSDFFNAIDKGNLGHAQTAGLSDDLNFKDNRSVPQACTITTGLC